MSTNGLKKRMMKFENPGDFGEVPGRGRQPVPVKVVDEVIVAVAYHVPNSATSARVASCELGVAW